MKIGDTEVLTLAEAADRLGVKRNTLVQQVRNGRLAATLSGNIYLVTADEVARYDAKRKQAVRGFAVPSHPMYGKQGPGHRRKANATGEGDERRKKGDVPTGEG